MTRQLQVKDGIASAEWSGDGASPVPPPGWTFVDVTSRPDAQIGMLYDSGTDTFSPAPEPPRDVNAPPTDTTSRDIANDLRAIKAYLGI